MTGSLLQMSGIVVDVIYVVDALPLQGEDIYAEKSLIAPGGGFNAMIAASRAGMDVTYGGTHGTGYWSDYVRGELDNAGIPYLQPQSDHGDQGTCVVLIDADRERTFVSKEGADGMLDEVLLGAVDPSGFGWVLMSGYPLAHPGSRNELHGWIKHLPEDVRFVFDPTQAHGRIPPEILETALQRADWVSANASEAMAVTGEPSPSDAARRLAGLSDRPGGAVVRCGRDGCWVSSDGDAADHIPGFAVDTIDTNGAGDCHVGAFIAALEQGQNAKDAARYANASAAQSTIRLGPATAPKHSEIISFLETLETSGRGSGQDEARRKVLL